jgi:parallel beta-helix repeat protein
MRSSRMALILTIIIFSMTVSLLAQYSGSYDIGGGNHDFTSVVNAANLISTNGLSGPVICNIYNTTIWDGQVTLGYPMPGLSPVNTLTFRNVTGQRPTVRAPFTDANVFRIDQVDYITIQGLEITDCPNIGIYIRGTSDDSCRNIRVIENYIHNVGTQSLGYSAIEAYDAVYCSFFGNKIEGDAWGIKIEHGNVGIIANNMVYGCYSTNNDAACILLFTVNNIGVYYNSCYATTGTCLSMTTCANPFIYNNALFQSGTGESYALDVWSCTNAICNYNDLYAPNGYVANAYPTGYQTLSEWQSASGKDLHSISANPNFVNANSGNLHVAEPSPLGLAGIAIVAVSTDYDGQTRKTPNSDIGADEYLFPMSGSYDVGGGGNHFATPVAAANRAALAGVSGAVTFNVYSGIYNGQINLPAIVGSSSINRIIFQPATGQTPIITNTTGTTQTNGNGFYLTGADYITIQNMEITNTTANGIYNSYSETDSSSYNRFIHNYIHDVGTSGDYNGIYLQNSPNCEILTNKIEADYNGIKLSSSCANMVINNMIYFAGLCGIYESEGNNNRYDFNSLYQEMSPTTTNDFYIYHATGIDLRNNILYHSGGGNHYAISITGDLTTYPLYSDYNDIYAPSAYVGFYAGNRTTLAEWQSATGQDAHSISADPSFVSLSTPDLHISPPSSVSGAGIAIVGITTDFDGDTRSSIPDIGADEFIESLAGTYDVGGGAYDFPSPSLAASYVAQEGMLGAVTFNIFSGSFNGTCSLPDSIPGLSETNRLTFQNAPGESPIITSGGDVGFRLTGTDYVTIQGLEIMNCRGEGILVPATSTDHSVGLRIHGNYIHDIAQDPDFNLAAINLTYGENCEITGNEIAGMTDAYYAIYLDHSNNTLLANNMIYDCEYSGINSVSDTYDSIYYNSVQNSGHYALLLDSRFAIVKNNILYQTGSGNHYAIYIAHSNTLPTASDHNDLYAPLGRVGYYTVIRTTLADWQTGTGLDAHSISADPNFVSLTTPFNLHVNSPSPVDGAGTPIAGITTDFDGDTRNPTTPDIGADEFGAVGPPGIVDDLTITLLDSTDDSTNITLYWSTTSGALQYHIYKSTTGPTSGFVEIGSTATTTYTDPNAMISETQSFYYVTSDNTSLQRVSSIQSSQTRPGIFRTSR